MKLYYHVVGVDGANRDFPKTVCNPVSIERVRSAIPQNYPRKMEILAELQRCFPSGQFNCWGTPEGARGAMEKLKVGDVVLLVKSTGQVNSVPALGQVKAFWPEELRELSAELWGESHFSYIFFFATEALDLEWTQLRSMLGYAPNYRPPALFHSVHADKLSGYPEGVKGFVQHLRTNHVRPPQSLERQEHAATPITAEEIGQEVIQGLEEVPSPKEVQEQATSIEATSNLPEPALTDDADSQKQPTQVIARSNAFRIKVKTMYQNRCAICNEGLQPPKGSQGQRRRAATEGAHIYPKAEKGSDDYRNGICLCLMHHWAFDAGWIAFSDDCCVLVRADLPDNAEYDFIRKFEGKPLAKPAPAKYAPHPLFLEARRRLTGF